MLCGTPPLECGLDLLTSWIEWGEYIWCNSYPSEIQLSKDCGFFLGHFSLLLLFSLGLCSLKKDSCHVMKQPHVEDHMVRDWGLPTPMLVRLDVSLPHNSRACRRDLLANHLTTISWEVLRQKHPAKRYPDFSLTEVTDSKRLLS